MAVQMVGSSAQMKVDCLALPTVARMVGNSVQTRAGTKAGHLALPTAVQMVGSSAQTKAARMVASSARKKAEMTADCLADYWCWEN